MKKYELQKAGGIYTGIGKTCDIPGYTETVIETSFPDDEMLKSMTKKQEKDWVKSNNEMMEAICELLNKKF